MAFEVIMPTLGLTMEEGTITEWLKQEGDLVAKDEPLFVVETDKAAMEVPAPASGVLSRIIAAVGATVAVREPIALIGDASQASAPAATGVPSATAGTTTVAGAPARAPHRQPDSRLRVSPAARRVARELGVDLNSLNGTGPEGRIVERDVRAVTSPSQAPTAASAADERIVASPLARKLAAEHGVDLSALRGSGPGGRIVERDVLAAVAAQPTPPTPTPTPGAAPAPTVAPAAGTVPLGRLRRITAERMAASSQTVARVTLFMPVDMAEAVRFRTQLAPEFERRYGARLSYDAMIAKAAALALRDHAELNAQWVDGAVRPLEVVNIGVAVALDAGLVVTVVRDADTKALQAIQSELNNLVEKARAGRLGPDDVSGSTFTITNLGGYGVEAFTPIVNLPEAAILGVGRIAKLPAVVDDALTIREQMTLSLAFDHRVADGAPAARFLQRLKEILEAPYLLLT
jgi:pyruvate dehydrogenase E2 component (dihydrolipoamide acetyltransferase)